MVGVTAAGLRRKECITLSRFLPMNDAFYPYFVIPFVSDSYFILR